MRSCAWEIAWEVITGAQLSLHALANLAQQVKPGSGNRSSKLPDYKQESSSSTGQL